ncbi:MAG: hypothetical protein JSR82_09055 [Verrucomicrobia bacterium]|nr:hypothetical protein [Verrucomicrobiota bacterium]
MNTIQNASPCAPDEVAGAGTHTELTGAAAIAKTYLLAVLLVGLVVTVRVGLLQSAGDPGLVYWLLPVLVSTRWGGLGPGIVATLLLGLGTADLSVLRAPAWLAHPIDPSLRWGILSLGIMIRAVVEARGETEAPAGGATDWLSRATEHLSEGLVVASSDGRLLHANRLGLECHGLEGTLDSIQDRTAFLRVIDPARPETPLEPRDWPLARILRGEEVQNLELDSLRLDQGSTRRFRFSGRLLPQAVDTPPVAVLTVAEVPAVPMAAAAVAAPPTPRLVSLAA